MKTKTLSGKYKNENISLEILGQSSITEEYMVQVAVIKNTAENRNLLDELGYHETCYRLTKNATYSKDELLKIIKLYKLER